MRKIIGTCDHIAQYDLRNFRGRIFFTTDIHGHFDLLHEELRKVAFNRETDILFVGGDLCDRGPHSNHVLDWLNEPWVHSVRGNHEEIFIGAVDENWKGRNTNCLLTNGGMWVIDLDDSEVKSIYDSFKSLPLGIELLLPRGRKVGVVHAEVPYADWDAFTNVDPEELKWNEMAIAQWSRSWYDRGKRDQVKGVDFVLVGHTPTDTGEIEKLGNMLFTDAGSFFRNKINLIELNDEFFRSVK